MSLSILIKPASSLCQMRCEYCFYADVSHHRAVASYGMMTEAVRDLLLARVKETGVKDVFFAFQGGEPTLTGLDFFKGFVAAAKKELPTCRIGYSLQTNGLALDDAFCRFLAENSFLVGLSLDGDEALHDLYRKDGSGLGTHARVLAAAERLRRFGVEFNILTVVTETLADRVEEIWQYYQRQGFGFVQFIPCLPSLTPSAEEKAYLTPRGYGRFLKTLFPLWQKDALAGRYISVRLFDNVVQQAFGNQPEQCGQCGRCAPQYVVEADGSVYPCDFYVLDEYRVGNLATHKLSEIFRDGVMQGFLTYRMPSECKGCPWLNFCRGNCKRYRGFYRSEGDYCPYRDFLSACREGILAVGEKAFS